MRPLLIDTATVLAAGELVKFASRRENWYRPRMMTWVPGDRPEYVLHFGTYRCVFTITEMDGKLFRHLSVSVPAKGMMPNPMATATIADVFGFSGATRTQDVVTGIGPKWSVHINKKDNCIVLVEDWAEPRQ